LEIVTQIQEAIEKRKRLILDAMDGRTQRHVAEKTGIDETKLSKWINGFGSLDQKELNSFNKFLGKDFS
jgi:transcriptional regulator with XRE-family HTH domain